MGEGVIFFGARRVLLLLHAGAAIVLLGAATHHALQMRHYLRGDFRRQALEKVKRWRIGSGQANQEPIVGVEARHRDSQALPQPALEGQLEGQVELTAERSQDGQSDLARRVAEGLDHDRPVVGDHARDPDLTRDVVSQGPGRRRFEPAFRAAFF